MNLDRRTIRLLAGVAVLVVGWLAQQAGIDLSALSGGEQDVRSAHAVEAAAGDAGSAVAEIEAAVAARRSGFMVTVDARVAKVLPDDNEGSRHQRFLIELANGRTLLIAHNIDLAKRAPIESKDSVRIRGQYEWNDRGGVLHWTHHDPKGRHPGGWIEHAGRRFE